MNIYTPFKILPVAASLEIINLGASCIYHSESIIKNIAAAGLMLSGLAACYFLYKQIDDMAPSCDRKSEWYKGSDLEKKV